MELFQALRKWEAAAREYNTIKNELNLEKACLNQMVKLESTLYDARPVVHDVTMRLGAMANVWAAIAADIRQIVYHSQSCGETRTSEKLFVQRVQRLEALYGCLSEALRYYQVTVWLPGARTLMESAIF
ncbi:hypothetical protein PAXINDRAFT_169936 [Paxillus involutus ATCC 200175]|uniref:Unplaced genomic scaffold PAXINscaffold_23, whole genome shotgun sequence n=1 Tax=Paxillus involutus ATCC 200175 TaxID=664439 RepID=A0A0C9U4F7_PAXIN|nr:hypothetical protein PAXINDRAFT_169936 [Paxillus involutus ATCC 200175]